MAAMTRMTALSLDVAMATSWDVSAIMAFVDASDRLVDESR